MTVLEDFFLWIVGIEEDDPLPYEIKYIYFSVSFANDICSLCYGGTEDFQKTVVNFDYFPLEAQFFCNSSFNNITEINLAFLELKHLLDDCFDNPIFAHIFNDKNVYICEAGRECFLYK